jgi:hypothetical protein
MTTAPPCRCTNAPVVPLPATTVALSPLLVGKALSYDGNDQLKVNVRVAATFQCQEPSGGHDADNVCRGAAPIPPGLRYNPPERDQVFVKLGFAAGNGLHPVSPFVLAPWAADLQDGVKNINGRYRNYLLEAWYAHTFNLGADSSMQITGGIIDPAVYVNENAYANDPFTQSTNKVFDSSRNALLPAYDWDGILVWTYRDWTLSGIGANVGENDDGNNYKLYAAEADCHIATALDRGNNRDMASGTSKVREEPGASVRVQPVLRLAVTRSHVAAAFGSTTRFELSPT